MPNLLTRLVVDLLLPLHLLRDGLCPPQYSISVSVYKLMRASIPLEGCVQLAQVYVSWSLRTPQPTGRPRRGDGCWQQVAYVAPIVGVDILSERLIL